VASIRPFFGAAWTKFAEINVPVPAVGKKLGGKVEYNIKTGRFQNACPIRMSYVLNYTGVPIPSAGYNVVSGADGKWYMFRVNDMMSFLEKTFGKADKMAKAPKPSDFAGLKGLIVVKGSGWNNARGHVTLWNGTFCSDTCHLMADPDNGTFTPEVASLWGLP
jgi:Type VI secretion system (T6SS), amidase effector protein 4